MILNYTNEFITNPDGVVCRVLDTTTIDFSEAPIGRKSKETIVLKANGNEKIETINSDGLVETTYITNKGDSIFINSEKDRYVPRDSEGNSWKFDRIEELGYEVTSEPFNYNGNIAIKVKSTKIANILPEVIEIPTCIKNAWGEGNHQFLFSKATLKQDPDTKKVTGIDKVAFDKTWEIVDKNRKSL